jgi:hypothetical protein
MILLNSTQDCKLIWRTICIRPDAGSDILNVLVGAAPETRRMAIDDSADGPDRPKRGPSDRRFRHKPTKKQTLARRKNAAKAREALKRKRQADPGFVTNPRGHPESLRGGKKGRRWITAKKRRFLRRIQHWKNQLPRDHPSRVEDGLTIDAFRAIEILEEGLTPAQRKRHAGALRRIKELKAELERMEENGGNKE